jgi:hypothetical protein
VRRIRFSTVLEPDCSGRWICSQLGVGADHVLLHVLRVRAGVADPLDSFDRVDPSQQIREADPLLARQIAPVAVDVLAQQGHLDDAVGR